MVAAIQQLTADTVDAAVNAFLAEARGVIHVGANAGQECGIYGNYGLPVIWIEPLEGVFDQLRQRVSSHANQRALQYLITDEDDKEYSLRIASNFGQSSSIYDFALHRQVWPGVHYVDSVKLRSVTLKTVIEREGIDLADYDTLIMDVQGAELLALKGLGELLARFRWIRAEAADYELYQGCCQLQDLDDYLLPRGWERRELFGCLTTPGIGRTYEALYHNVSLTKEVQS